MSRRIEQVTSATLVLLALALVLAASGVLNRHGSHAAQPQGGKLLDPAAWGSDHVGQDRPEYLDSGECLFCHRAEFGAAWATNKHNRAMRDAEPTEPAMAALEAGASTREFAADVTLILGDTRAQRFLKRSQAYGKADLSSVIARMSDPVKLEHTENPRWDEESFALKCAGCHATAVDPDLHAFSTVSIDCFSCHGDATPEHSNDTSLMTLSKKRKDSPAVVTSICASCHIRFGKSKATGLPYSTNFVAGDNLFKDFEVDWAKADDESLNPGDRHVMQNVREVVLYGNESVTCLSCHEVHSGSTRKHRNQKITQTCDLCHEAARPIKGSKAYEVHSERCEY